MNSIERIAVILRFFVANIDYILALIISAWLFGCSFVGADISEEYIRSATLAVLTILSFSLLRDRKFGKNKLRDVLSIKDNYQEVIKIIIKESKNSIWIVLRSGSIFYEISSEFENALLENKELKIYVIACKRNDPDLFRQQETFSNNKGTELNTMNASGHEVMERFSSRFNTEDERFIVKYVDFIPPQIIYLNDPENWIYNPFSKAFVLPISYGENVRKSPSLLISRYDNPGLYWYYFNQAQAMHKHQNHEEIEIND